MSKYTSFYIASRFRNKPLVKDLAEQLRGARKTVCCSWVEEEPNTTSPRDAALQDLFEIRKSDAVLVVTTDCDLVPGGMHFEAGYALGKDIKVFLLGPAVNIFYELPQITKITTVEDLFYL